MKRIVFAIVCILVISSTDAQSISRTTVEQYRQLVAECTGGNTPQSRKTLEYCAGRLEQWGFTFNRSRVIDMYNVHMNPFYRPEGEDTVGCMITTADDAVTSVSGIYTSTDPARTFALLAAAAELQSSLAAERGLGKFVCSVKGNVKNKFPKNVDEFKEAISGVGADDIKKVYISWDSADRSQKATLVYDNHLAGKKKPKASDRAELTIAVSDTRNLR